MDYVHLLKKRGLRGKNIKSELGIMINWCHLVSKFVLLLVKEYGKPQKSSSLNGREEMSDIKWIFFIFREYQSTKIVEK